MRKKYGRKRHPELALNSRKSLKEKKKKKKETLIGEAIQKKKGFSLLGSIKISLEQWGKSCGLMSSEFPCSRVMAASR